MTYQEAELFLEKIVFAIHDRFQQTYPDTFKRSRAKTKEDHEQSNPSMYSWYMIILNNLSVHDIGFNYKDEDYINKDYKSLERFLDDFNKSENWQSFLIENLYLRR